MKGLDIFNKKKFTDIFLRKQDRKQDREKIQERDRYHNNQTIPFDENYFQLKVETHPTHLGLLKVQAIINKGQKIGEKINLKCKWFLRSSTDFKEIQQVTGCFYQPCIDDINSSISLHIQPYMENRQYDGVTLIKQLGSIKLDEKIQQLSKQAIKQSTYEVLGKIESVNSLNEKFQKINQSQEISIIISKQDLVIYLKIRHNKYSPLIAYEITQNFPKVQMIRKTSNSFILHVNQKQSLKISVEDNIKRDVFTLVLRSFCEKKYLEFQQEKKIRERIQKQRKQQQQIQLNRAKVYSKKKQQRKQQHYQNTQINDKEVKQQEKKLDVSIKEGEVSKNLAIMKHDYDLIKLDYDSLKREYNIVKCDYDNIKRDYDILKNNNEIVKNEKSSIQNNNDTLKSDYDIMKHDYENLQQKYENEIKIRLKISSQNQILCQKMDKLHKFKQEGFLICNQKKIIQEEKVKLQEQKTKLHKYKTQQEEKKTKLQQYITELEEQKSKLEEQKSKLQQQKIKLQQQKIKLEEQTSKSQQQKSKFQQYITKLEEQTSKLEQQKNKLQQQKIKLQQQKIKLEEQKSKLQHQKSKFQQYITKLEEQKSKLEEQKSKLEQQKNKLQQQKIKLQQQKIKLEEQKSKLQQQKNKLEEQKSKLEEQKSKLEQQKNKLQQQKIKLQQQKIKLHEQNNFYISEIGLYKKQHRQNQQLRLELKKKIEQLINQVNNNQNFVKQQLSIPQLRILELQNQNKHLQLTKDELNNKIQFLQMQNKRMNNKCQALIQVSNQKTQLKQQNKKQLDQKDAEINALKSQIFNLQILLNKSKIEKKSQVKSWVPWDISQNVKDIKTLKNHDAVVQSLQKLVNNLTQIVTQKEIQLENQKYINKQLMKRIQTKTEQ